VTPACGNHAARELDKLRPRIAGQLRLSQSSQDFGLAADRSRSTRVQLVPDPV